MGYIKKVKWPEPKPTHECPPRVLLIFGPVEPPAPGSVWECDICKKQYELEDYFIGIGRWKELQTTRTRTY